MNPQIEMIVRYAFSFIETPYDWGGDDPISGFDCSGFVQELLMAAQVVPRGTPKMRAQDIFDRLSREQSSILVNAQAGALAFYGRSIADISHVGFCVSDRHIIAAGGGDSTVVDSVSASRRNAFVRMDFVNYRKDGVVLLLPTYP